VHLVFRLAALAAGVSQSVSRSHFPLSQEIAPMSDRDLFDAVARKTGEDSREIARRGFSLTGPDDAGPEPENLLDMLLVDLPETGTVDWDALGFGCREPFFTSDLKARRRKGSVKASSKKQTARAA
jgi:hypothetical protein